ncbi:MAG TPA: response regulator [Reyranella sp.]|nr:response regulator [Reyranella sp.]
MREAVLILEDEYLIATQMAGFVAGAGYRVVGPAASSEAAQELINETGIDAALLDIALAGDERSLELAARLQAMRIPFGFITAYPPALLPTAFRGVPFVTKPVSRGAVVHLLSELLKPLAARAPSPRSSA